MLFTKPAPGAGTNVVTVCVACAIPRLLDASPAGVASAVNVFVTLTPLGNVALGKVRFTVMSQFAPGATEQALVHVSVTGVVPTQPG